jgi:hypothetical protein
MYSGLIRLKGLIQTYSDYNLTGSTLEELQELETVVDETVQRLMREIDDEADLSRRADNIQLMQSQLTYMADEIAGFENMPTSHPFPPIFKNFLVGKIFYLLKHIRYYFPQEFNNNYLLPKEFLIYNQHQKQEPIINLLAKLSRMKTDIHLIELLNIFFNSHSHPRRFKIDTWRQWAYQETLFNVIDEIEEIVNPEFAEYYLLQLLIAYNFNSIQIYGYFMKFIEKITLSDNPIVEQLQRLNYLQKIFRQVRLETNESYDASAPILKESVISGLDAEITYLEQKEKIFADTFKPSQADHGAKFYFKVAVTLAELIFFFRIALEVGFFATKFKSYLYEFVTNHIQTERAENFSKKSMRNHYNNKPFSDKVVGSIRSWMEKMIKHIDLHY